MAAYTVTPAVGSALADAYAPGSWEDPRQYAAMVAKRVDHLFKLGPLSSEILALIAGSLASSGHRKTWVCASGLAVGDPVYVSAADTVTLADATTAVKAKVIGFCRYKPSTTSCHLDLVMRKTGLTGLTAGSVVYLSDAGAISATAGTVSTVIGKALSTTEAEVVACGLMSIADSTPAAEPSVVQSLLLNGGFETVLYGTHTSAIKTHGVASTVKNTQFPGWQGVTPGGSPSMAVDAETTTISTSGKQSLKVSSVALGTDDAPVCLEQRWNATHFLEERAADCRGQYITFALDVKLSAATASACRIGISVDGGGNWTYSSYKANDTSWERLVVSVAVGSSATDVRFRISMESATPTYYFDCGMACVSTSALTALAYAPRLPIAKDSYCTTEYAFVGGPTAQTYPIACDDSGNLSSHLHLNDVRPHWATHAVCKLELAASTGDRDVTLYVGPNGSTTTNALMEQHWILEDKFVNTISAPAEIGKDGLLGVGISANSICRVDIKNWIGRDL